MGCILACLRLNKDKKKKKDSLKSSPVPSKSKEPLLPKHIFGSVFESEASRSEQVVDVNDQEGVDEEDIWEREVRVEAKYLKSCGALLQTPAEFRKVSGKLITETLDNEAYSSNTSHLSKKLVWDEPHEESICAQNNPSSLDLEEEHQSQSPQDNALSSALAVLDVSSSENDIQTELIKCKDAAWLGSITSENDTGVKSSEGSIVLDVSAPQIPKIQPLDSKSPVCLGSGMESVVLDISPSQDDTQIKPPGSNHYSPFATPLKLSEEMETPATIFPVGRGSIQSRITRVRTQYVYPIQREESNKMQQTPVASSLRNQNDKRSFYRKELDKENDGSVKRLRIGTAHILSSPENPQLVTSLSGWLKFPRGSKETHGMETSKAMSSYCPNRTPEVERPIFGLVSMHWNENNPSQDTPKWWGGNGIPNTTTKYKEDQKVSWHATPFEERLNKALSIEKLFPQRKDIGRDLVGVEVESKETDIAASS